MIRVVQASTEQSAGATGRYRYYQERMFSKGGPFESLSVGEPPVTDKE